jgi:hypothetical protein
MPCPRSLRGAEPSEGAQSVRLPVLRVHLALRRCSQRPSIDRMALDFRQFSFRHVTRVSPSNSFSVFSLFSALSAGSCPLALSGSGKPLTQGSPLNPSHLRWGCCMHYCGAPDAGGSQLQALDIYCGPLLSIPPWYAESGSQALTRGGDLKAILHHATPIVLRYRPACPPHGRLYPASGRRGRAAPHHASSARTVPQGHCPLS